MRKLILFGDSNTYGYDPRGFMGGRYPEKARWATIVRLALADSYEVIEEGMNGRQLPDVEYGYFTNMFAELTADDTMVMMLGTNDILLTYNPDPEQAAAKMERILAYVKGSFAGRFIMIAPPYIEETEPGLQIYRDAGIQMNKRFMELAGKYDIEAFDAAAWNIPMGYDGVHFSIEGHHRFAEMLLSIMRITEMEAILDSALQMLDDENTEGLKAYEPEIEKLGAYYTGREWKDDFALDEAGKLPADLKRGVLSEDGIYNMLERYKELLE